MKHKSTNKDLRIWQSACSQGTQDQLDFYMIENPNQCRWEYQVCGPEYIRVNKCDPEPTEEYKERMKWESMSEEEQKATIRIQELEQELNQTKETIKQNYERFNDSYKEDEIESLKAQKQQLIDEYTNFVKHEIPHTKERIKQTYSPFNIQQISKSGDRIITEIKELIESPISLEHFIDPFQAPSGHTFDQTDSDSIMRSGVDPITRVPLSPNHIRPHFICKHITDLIRHHTD
ncbi:unnamed protein product [Moneuplotes crassus]|uniref:U-box domain-containing protein n=1 Tax=Euplotes crassus TaxID=5936 RepID=A0AAD1XV49_EUPCR|nr:unnamed protein product [Moneuplotes crassus]